MRHPSAENSSVENSDNGVEKKPGYLLEDSTQPKAAVALLEKATLCPKCQGFISRVRELEIEARGFVEAREQVTALRSELWRVQGQLVNTQIQRDDLNAELLSLLQKMDPAQNSEPARPPAQPERVRRRQVPEGWHEMLDEAGELYYFHSATGTMQSEFPGGDGPLIVKHLSHVTRGERVECTRAAVLAGDITSEGGSSRKNTTDVHGGSAQVENEHSLKGLRTELEILRKRDHAQIRVLKELARCLHHCVVERGRLHQALLERNSAERSVFEFDRLVSVVQSSEENGSWRGGVQETEFDTLLLSLVDAKLAARETADASTREQQQMEHFKREVARLGLRVPPSLLRTASQPARADCSPDASYLESVYSQDPALVLEDLKLLDLPTQTLPDATSRALFPPRSPRPATTTGSALAEALSARPHPPRSYAVAKPSFAIPLSPTPAGRPPSLRAPATSENSGFSTMFVPPDWAQVVHSRRAAGLDPSDSINLQAAALESERRRSTTRHEESQARRTSAGSVRGSDQGDWGRGSSNLVAFSPTKRSLEVPSEDAPPVQPPHDSFRYNSRGPVLPQDNAVPTLVSRASSTALFF